MAAAARINTLVLVTANPRTSRVSQAFASRTGSPLAYNLDRVKLGLLILTAMLAEGSADDAALTARVRRAWEAVEKRTFWKEFQAEFVFGGGHAEPWQRKSMYEHVYRDVWWKRLGSLRDLRLISSQPVDEAAIEAELERARESGLVVPFRHGAVERRLEFEGSFTSGTARVTAIFGREHEGEPRILTLVVEPRDAQGRPITWKPRSQRMSSEEAIKLLDEWWPRFLAETPRDLLPDPVPKDWRYVLSPPLPLQWPPRKGSQWIRYAYANQPGKGGGLWWSAWTSIFVEEGQPGVLVSPIGDCLGGARYSRVHLGSETANSPLFDSAPKLTRPLRRGTAEYRQWFTEYDEWFRHNVPLVDSGLLDRHRSFFDWLNKESGRMPSK